MTRIVFLLVLVIASPVLASAQDLPAVEVRTAFGISNYLHGDIDYTTPTWLLAVRLGKGAIAFEPEFTLSRHEETETFDNGTLTPTVQVSSTRYSSFAGNIIGRWGSRVSGYAGGGVGVYSERRRFTQTSGDLVFENDRTQGPRAGAQVVGGIDVPVASRIKIFGQARYEIRSFEDPGGGSVVQGFAGVTFVVK
jgi:hypothetical protein